MIDTHAHLFLCEAARPSWSRPPGRPGSGGCSPSASTRTSNRGGDRGGRAPRGGLRRVGRHPNSATGFDDAAAAEIARLAAHEKVRAIGETGLDYYRDRADRERPAARLRGPDRDRPRLRPAARDPRPRPGGRQTTAIDEVFEILDASAEAAAGDPALLLGPERVAGRGRARLVLLVRRQRHLPQAPRRCARRRRALPGRAAPGRDRLAVPGAAAGARQAERAGQRRRDRAGRRRGPRRSTYEAARAHRRGQRRAALFGW